MARGSLISLASTLLLATVTNAQVSLLHSIDFDSTLDLYYSFREGNGSVSISNDGILIEVSSTDDSCSALAGLEIVYSKDSAPDVLLTSNCLSVYELVDTSGNAITWSSCEEFDPIYCPSTSSSTSLYSSDSSTNAGDSAATQTSTIDATTATATPVFISDGETLALSTVTSTIDGIVTTYTTYCPLTTSESDADATAESILTTVTSTIDGVVTTYTTYCPLTTEDAIGYTTSTIVSTTNGIVSTVVSEVAVSAIVDTPTKLIVTDTDYYDSQTTSSEAAIIETTVTTIVNGVETIYTTYCPLSTNNEAATTTEAVVTTGAVTTTEVVVTTEGVPTTEAVVTTEAVTITEVVASSQTASVANIQSTITSEAITTTIQEQSEGSTSSAVAVSTFEGAAARKLASSITALSIITVFVGFFI